MINPRVQIISILLLATLALSLLFSIKANPDFPPLFALKRVQEKIFLKFKSNPEARVDFMSNLLSSRLEELQNVFDHKSYDYILPAASRYSTLAGQITALVVANNLTDKAAVIKNQFLNHQKIVKAIYVAYPKNTDNVEYKYIEDDYNYLGLYLDQLAKVKSASL